VWFNSYRVPNLKFILKNPRPPNNKSLTWRVIPPPHTHRHVLRSWRFRVVWLLYSYVIIHPPVPHNSCTTFFTPFLRLFPRVIFAPIDFSWHHTPSYIFVRLEDIEYTIRVFQVVVVHINPTTVTQHHSNPSISHDSDVIHQYICLLWNDKSRSK
jgi:hypothetical protein